MTLTIADAIAAAKTHGRLDAVEHMKGTALHFVATVQARVLAATSAGHRRNAPPSSKVLQCNLTILAFCIGEGVFAVNRDELVATGELKDVCKKGDSMILYYTADTDKTVRTIELTDIENLRSSSGTIVLFGKRIFHEMPNDWVWNWTKVRYLRGGPNSPARYVS
jgi:hypothetical protein